MPSPALSAPTARRRSVLAAAVLAAGLLAGAPLSCNAAASTARSGAQIIGGSRDHRLMSTRTTTQIIGAGRDRDAHGV